MDYGRLQANSATGLSTHAAMSAGMSERSAKEQAALQAGLQTTKGQPDAPLSHLLLKEVQYHFETIAQALNRVEGAANRLVGARPTEQIAESAAIQQPHHAGQLGVVAAALASLERRLRAAADQLESFV